MSGNRDPVSARCPNYGGGTSTYSVRPQTPTGEPGGLYSINPDGYNKVPHADTTLRRHAIASPEPPRRASARLKHKRAWGLPATVVTATAARYLPGHHITELLNQLLPEPVANAITTTAQWVNATDPTYLVIIVAAAAYWASRERIDQVATELIIMLYKGIFQRARRAVIADAHHKGRTEMLQELKDKAPLEVKAWLEEADGQTQKR